RAAPMRASTIDAVSEVAVTETLSAWTIDTPLPIAARVDSSMMERANATPTPTLPVPLDPAPTGRAVTVTESAESATTKRSASRRLSGERTLARVSWSTIAMATEPATETPPAAPDDAAAPTMD